MFYHSFSWMLGRLISMFIGLVFLAIPIALVVLYIAAVVWVYRDATRKNMNPLLWVLIVILVPSPIGFIIYLIARTNNSSYRTDIIKCRNCGSSIDASSNVCPYCGDKLKKVCPNCGRPVKGDWRVCPDCGTYLDKRYDSQNN